MSNYTDLSDKELIRNLIKFEKENKQESNEYIQSTAILFRRHIKKLISFASNKVPLYDAEDLVQEVFIIAFTKIQTFNENYSFSSWLFGILKNKILQRLHQNRDLNTISIDEMLADNVSLINLLADQSINIEKEYIQKSRVTDLLNNLSQIMKDVIYMKINMNMTHEEISERLGISPANSAQIYKRALDKLKKIVRLETCE